MTIFDWLASADGQDLTHAVILLVLAVAAFLSFRTHNRVEKIEKRVKGEKVDE